MKFDFNLDEFLDNFQFSDPVILIIRWFGFVDSLIKS